MGGGWGRSLKAVLLCPWCGASQECDLAKPCQARGTDQPHLLNLFYPGKHLSQGRSSLAANIHVADTALWGYPSHLFHPSQQPAAPSSLLASSPHSHLCAKPDPASCPASLHPPWPSFLYPCPQPNIQLLVLPQQCFLLFFMFLIFFPNVFFLVGPQICWVLHRAKHHGNAHHADK